jgi:hypothetical protein
MFIFFTVWHEFQACGDSNRLNIPINASTANGTKVASYICVVCKDEIELANMTG